MPRILRGASKLHATLGPEKPIAMNLVRRHGSRNSTNPCITIVDGDIALALALSDNLKTEGYVVESVDRGDEAVKKLADAPPDLVFWIGCRPAYRAPKFVPDCARRKRLECCRS